MKTIVLSYRSERQQRLFIVFILMHRSNVVKSNLKICTDLVCLWRLLSFAVPKDIYTGIQIIVATKSHG